MKLLKAAIFYIGIEVILFICVVNYIAYSGNPFNHSGFIPMLSIVISSICLGPLLVLSASWDKPKQKRKPKDD